ncbi:hypothetical protein D3C87_1269770 [compost metagenome]
MAGVGQLPRQRGQRGAAGLEGGAGREQRHGVRLGRRAIAQHAGDAPQDVRMHAGHPPHLLAGHGQPQVGGGLERAARGHAGAHHTHDF